MAELLPSAENVAPAEQTRTRTLLRNMRDNGSLNEGEYRALLSALRADLVEAVWAARAEEARVTPPGLG